jgi:hypothetical protein
MGNKNSKTSGEAEQVAKPLTGIPLEKAVARIQEMIDPNSHVTHDELLTDRLGNKRQFDVVIRGTFAGHSVLGVVECKDHNRKNGPGAVEAFAKKCENLGANVKIMVSRLGFTSQALTVAKHEKVICLSLLPGDYGQTGLTLTMTAYAQIWEWADILFGLDDADTSTQLGEYTADDVLLNGRPVLDLFLRELGTTYAKHKTAGPLKKVLDFDHPVVLDIRGQRVSTQRVRFRATRICRHKTKQLRLFGDAAFDWHTDKWTFPKGGQVFGSEWKGDYSDWDDYDGTIPAANSELFRSLIVVYRLPCLPESTTPGNETRSDLRNSHTRVMF